MIDNEMCDHPLAVSSYTKLVDSWIRTRGVRYFDLMTNVAILTEEVGEVARIVAREWGEQSWAAGKQPPPLDGETDDAYRRRLLADELSDLCWVIACIANQTGIDLEEALRQNLDKKETRDGKRHQANPKLKE